MDKQGAIISLIIVIIGVSLLAVGITRQPKAAQETVSTATTEPATTPGKLDLSFDDKQAQPANQTTTAPSPLTSPQTTAKKEQKNMKATISTTLGDIQLELFAADAPKTVENFTTLAKKGYYNGVIFHRVIKDFMIQGGDPTGTGRGGESAWGGKFEDEINSHKIVPGTIAMANAGPNTNGSQFFIVTESSQPHLDGHHTVFGQVTGGMDVVKKIAAVEVDQMDKPLQDVKMTKITIEE